MAIIGDGAMGTALGLLLAERGLSVTLWGAFPENIDEIRRTCENARYLPGYPLPKAILATADAGEALRGAELIVSAVPCQFIRGVWQRFAGLVPTGVPICSISKGIENETLLRPTQIIEQVLGRGRALAVLSGPSIADEVARRLPASLVAASEDGELAERIQQTFSTEWFRVYRQVDVVGVELAGATKNVIALAAGIIDGLGAGDNAKAALLARGLVEITRLGVALGAKRETFAGLAGMGDLFTTCASPHGRNRKAGEMLGRGAKTAEVIRATNSVIEGIPTTRSVVELAARNQIEMPITQQVYHVLFDDKDPREAIRDLMSRQLISE